MLSSNELHASAEHAAKERGHDLDGWYKTKNAQIATCVNCGAKVAIYDRSYLRESRIQGSAVSRECEDATPISK